MAVLAEQVHLVAERDERRGEARVVDVGAGAVQQVAVEDQDAHPRRQPTGACRGLVRARSAAFARVRAVSVRQRYRLRNPASGREIVLEASPEEIYRDRDIGRDARGRRQAAAARALHLAAPVGGREPALLPVVQAARPEGSERLPDVRPADGPAGRVSATARAPSAPRAGRCRTSRSTRRRHRRAVACGARAPVRPGARRVRRRQRLGRDPAAAPRKSRRRAARRPKSEATRTSTTATTATTKPPRPTEPKRGRSESEASAGERRPAAPPAKAPPARPEPSRRPAARPPADGGESSSGGSSATGGSESASGDGAPAAPPAAPERRSSGAAPSERP